jgi:hypothetical protein
MSSRPKSSRKKAQENQQIVLSPQDEKLIKELQRLIAKQEQLLRGKNFWIYIKSKFDEF